MKWTWEINLGTVLICGAAVYVVLQPKPVATASIATPIALYARPPLPSQWDREIVTMLALRGCTQLAAELCGDHAGCYSQKLERCLWH